MELRSEPQYEDIQVTDIDISFPGDHQNFTLWPGDALEMDEKDNTMTLTFAHGGIMVFNLDHAHFFAKKQRIQRVKAETIETKDKE